MASKTVTRSITVNGWTNFDSNDHGAWKGYIWDFKGLRYWSKLMSILQNCSTKINISSVVKPLEKTQCAKNNFLEETLVVFHEWMNEWMITLFIHG